MRLFREPTEPDESPKRNAEDIAAFLRRSTRPRAARIRAELNAWFARYPSRDQRDLSRRFAVTFEDPFFELLCHELLIRVGCSVEIHPALAHTTRRPDFRATAAGGERAYLEAAVVSGMSDDERQVREAHDLILDALNTFNHPNFFFGVADIVGIPRQTPSRATLHSLLAECVEGLDPDTVTEECSAKGGGIYALPRRGITHAGLTIEVFAIPKSVASRGKPGLRAIGIGPTRGGVICNDDALRAVIKRKGQAYGTLEEPFIVAVNSIGEFEAEVLDITNALYGSEHVCDPRPGEELQLIHARDGVWTGGPTPTYTRISAVLFGSAVFPWNVGDAELLLFHNPWAAHPYRGPLTDLTQVTLEGDRLVTRPGKKLAELFDIAPGWPNA